MLKTLLVPAALLLMLTTPPAAAGEPDPCQELQLDDTWTLTAFGQTTQPGAGGTFFFGNIPAEDQFGFGGPSTGPDTFSDDPIPVVGSSTMGGMTCYAYAPPFHISTQETYLLNSEAFTLTTIPPPLPVSISLSPVGVPPPYPGQPLNLELNQELPLSVLGVLNDESVVELAHPLLGTTFRVSNPALLDVIVTDTDDPTAPVIIQSGTLPGIARVTATNGGSTAVFTVNVMLPETVPTAIEGFVVREDGSFVPGATVVLNTLNSTTTDSTGFFNFDLPAVHPEIPISAQAIAEIDGEVLVGHTPPLPVVYYGLIDAGLIVLSPVGDGPLFPMPQFLVGERPEALAVADLNSDGFPDAVTANKGTNDLSILFNGGSGLFLAAGIYDDIQSAPNDVVIADLNGDAFPDLALAGGGGSAHNGTVILQEPQGPELFGPPMFLDYAPISTPTALVAADFDGGNGQDLAFMGDTVRLMLNDGVDPPSFTAGNTLNVNGMALAAADLDSDEDIDLAVLTQDELRIFLNDGTAAFAAGGSYLPDPNRDNYAYHLALGDVDGDAAVDAVVASRAYDYTDPISPDTLSILLNDGDGNLLEPATMVTLPFEFRWPAMIALADVDEDQDLDIAVLTDLGGPDDDGLVGVLLNNSTPGNAVFADPLELYDLEGKSYRLAAGYFDGDQYQDLAAGSGFGASSEPGLVTLLLGKGDGTFRRPFSMPTEPEPNAIAMTDLDLDPQEAVDLVLAFDDAVSVSYNAGGYFEEYEDVFTVAGPSGIVFDFLGTGDFDGFGEPEIVAGIGSDFYVLTWNAEAGAYLPAEHVGELHSSWTAIGEWDLHLFGPDDLITGQFGQFTFPDVLTVLLNDSQGGFATPYEPLPIDSGQYIVALTLADFDHDSPLHFTDAAVVFDGCGFDLRGDCVQLVLNDGESFITGELLALAEDATPRHIVTADFNNDTWPDLAVASPAIGVVSVFINQAVPGEALFSERLDYPLQLPPNYLAAGDYDGDGWIDLAVVGDRLTLLINAGEEGGGALVPQSAFYYTPGTSAMALEADVDHDGDLDLVVSTGPIVSGGSIGGGIGALRTREPIRTVSASNGGMVTVLHNLRVP